MMRWFRFYNDAMRNPKVAQLSDAHFRLWVELLCMASEYDGRIPHEESLKALLRRRLDHLKAGLSALLKAGLIDALEDGYTPHDWDKRQYKSDLSTERSRKHREKCNVAETVSATAPDTDTETDTENNIDTSPDGEPPLSVLEVVEAWNELADDCDLPKVGKLTDSRKRRLQARIRQYPEVESWRAAFGTIRRSPFLQGNNARGWKADFDFLLQDKSFTKLVEGSYGQA